jgi:spermidine synthase
MRNHARKLKENNSEHTTTHFSSKQFLPWMLFLFVGSGCAALIYEVVWLQLLQLTIGSTGISMGVLLGTFMGGMCLGSLLLPRIISARFHPLKVYAFLELGIAVLGLLILFSMPLITDIYTSLTGHGIMARAAIAVICLILPTVLMGATLPAISRCVKGTPDGVSWMGFFYAGNTGGAVLGCLLAGFFLLRVYDMPTATYVAVAINIAVSLLALLLAAKQPWQPTTEPPEENAAPPLRQPGVYMVIGLSGACALGAEVVWTRLLSLMLGQTVYTFSIILAVFLTGLGIGSSVGAWLAKKIRKARTALGTCQILIAAATAWAVLIINKIPYWEINPITITKESGPWYMFLIDLLRSGCALLPATLLWGASFPLALAAVASREKDSGRMVGGVYAANTVGAIFGSIFFSMLVIPKFGTLWGQRLVMVIAVISAIIALRPFLLSQESSTKTASPSPKKKLVGAVIGIAVVGVLLVRLAPVPWAAVAFGRYAPQWMPLTVPGITEEVDVPYEPAAKVKDRYCLFVGEGMNVSVAVTKSNNGFRYFHGAGKVQASSNPHDMRLQRMLGHLSVLTRPNPDDVEDVLVVACGAGVTAGSFIPYPEIENITICDIEPLVPQQVTPMFGDQNYHIVDGIAEENPHMVNGKKVEVAYDDGRHYLRTLPEDVKFDIITSDPIDPWVKGCAALNTVEYYEMCKEHLKPGGVVTLWMPLYESDEETVKSLISTFFEVFPNGMFFSNDLGGVGYDAVLLGYVDPVEIDVDRLQEILAQPKYTPVTESLKEVGFGADTASLRLETNLWGDPTVALLSTYAGRAADLGEWMKDAQINTDRNMRLQYLAGMSVNLQLRKAILDSILTYYRFPEDLFYGSEENMRIMKVALQSVGRTE